MRRGIPYFLLFSVYAIVNTYLPIIYHLTIIRGDRIKENATALGLGSAIQWLLVILLR